jgi:hypothetical protein
MTHDHDDPLELTIGCDACIERRVISGIAAALKDWNDEMDDWACCGEEPETQIPRTPITFSRMVKVYKQLRNWALAEHEARQCVSMWADELRGINS